ncbi:hypothetical protein P3X46_028564 [Hevea brasiliensis]|uniref:DUF1997 domain-containing protein n=1 Tax=Hevea brasiliensis TaxID=3981 RepID=A0ABQ9KQU7_HEVBR|nr:uncharacterized protein LOC110641710 isoform X2 [Hevea brasiliensis]XP_021649242.1 uncharacterized protein LOC110641710 isoform X2 [Hevea brasiliensis]KAJ9146279.1 hypothetical protein P3X46_028564 [Hevea brasiliensis]
MLINCIYGLVLMMTMIVTSSNTWRLTRGQEVFSVFPSLAFPFLSTIRKRIERVGVCKANMSVQNSKKANLTAAKRERILLPICDDGYRISEFLSHPFGIQAMLNTKTLQSFESIDANTYRCFLPKLQLLNFEAAPVLDLRVIPTEEDCTVEMLSCKFEGSEIMERQNDHFSAFMVNRVTWNTTDSEPFLEADMKLNLTLEIYTEPFTLLPTYAVEGPGNLMMQALVDRLVTLLLQQLLQEYDKWENQQCENVPRISS